MTLPLPADLALAECASCGEGFPGEADATAMDGALELAYDQELRRRAIVYLDALAVVIPQRRLEVLLGVSIGLLSEVRSNETPSAQLVTELALLAADPEAGIMRLEKFWETKAPSTATLGRE